LYNYPSGGGRRPGLAPLAPRHQPNLPVT
jgi:hypothetical protein